MEINKFYRCKESSRNNYRSRNLIGHYPFWVISPGNSTSFTRPFLTGRHTRVGHKTKPHEASLRWDSSHSAEVNENINLSYSQDQGYS